MKGMTEAMMKVMIALIVGGLLFVGILYILGFFNEGETTLCRWFCLKLADIKYLGDFFCNICG